VPEVVIYGKIIIDDIPLHDGSIARGLLGGGGPQAVFGARLWSNSVGLLSRAGSDLSTAHRQALADLAANLDGVALYPDLSTLRAPIHESAGLSRGGDPVAPPDRAWDPLLARRLVLPASYRHPRLVHLITEYPEEPMVHAALGVRERGALLSIEPLMYLGPRANQVQLAALLPMVDIVTPDWPSAANFAGSDDPCGVLRCWSLLGPKIVAVRCGAEGSYVWSGGDGQGWHIPAVPVCVDDETGAGNSYGGGLCAGWLRHRNAVEAGVFAAVSASFMLEHIGMPTTPAKFRPTAQRRLRTVRPTVTPL
jgi:sugar/nucleoside kinase (ribokinase family)